MDDTGGHVEVSTPVGAPPETVWELLRDPTRMGEWSPELESATWLGGATEAAIGVRFRGINRRGWRRWPTVSRVSLYEPGRSIGWDVSSMGLAVATWTYRIERDGEGSTLIEAFSDSRGAVIRRVGTVVRGVHDVESHNRAIMMATLSSLRAAAEAQGATR